MLNIDKQKFEKVIGNILSNAFKHTPKYGTIGVGLEVAHDHAIITISDSGVGIAKEHIHRIFDLYYTAGLSRTTQGYRYWF